MIPAWPTLAEVEAADREQLARWYRFLPSGNTEEQMAIVTRVCTRFAAVGMFTPELSKRVGWKP